MNLQDLLLFGKEIDGFYENKMPIHMNSEMDNKGLNRNVTNLQT